MTDAVTVKGVAQLAAGSRRLAAIIAERAQRSLVTVADHEATTVRGKVPRRSGRLAGSVTAQPGGEIALLTMGAGVPYAAWIEYGGSRGRPYVAAGRYVYPTALAGEPLALAAGARAADDAIGGFSWPPV